MESGCLTTDNGHSVHRSVHRAIPIDAREEWNGALRGIPHTFSHTWEHCFAMQMTTGYRTFLYVFENQGVRVIVPFAERHFGGYIDIVKPYGFSGFVSNGACHDFRHYWKEYVTRKGYVCGYLGLNPVYDRSSCFESAEIVQHDTVYVFDLAMSQEAMLASMGADRRQQLKKYHLMCNDFIVDKPELKIFFLDHYHEFLRSRKASPYYYFSRETLSYLCDLDNVGLVGVKLGDKVVAVKIFAFTEHIGDDLFTISLPEGRNYSTALIWYVVNYLKSMNIPALNLGGGGGSLGEYKKRFGTASLPLKSVKQVYDADIYAALCRGTGENSGLNGGFFPAYRKQEYEREIQRVKSL
jgi:hypothetical protein